MCAIYFSDPTDELLMIIGIFTHFFAVETTLAERQFFRALAKLIGKRAARLSACGIAAIVSKKGYLDEGCSVGADGSLYNVSATFPECFHAFFSLCYRNIQGSLIEFTKAWLISLATRGGMLLSFGFNSVLDLSSPGTS